MTVISDRFNHILWAFLKTCVLTNNLYIRPYTKTQCLFKVLRNTSKLHTIIGHLKVWTRQLTDRGKQGRHWKIVYAVTYLEKRKFVLETNAILSHMMRAFNISQFGYFRFNIWQFSRLTFESSAIFGFAHTGRKRKVSGHDISSLSDSEPDLSNAKPKRPLNERKTNRRVCQTGNWTRASVVTVATKGRPHF